MLANCYIMLHLSSTVVYTWKYVTIMNIYEAPTYKVDVQTKQQNRKDKNK